MLSANKEKLATFFSGTNQFIIPFFQRAYVWKEENWSELWDNIIEELNELKNDNKTSEHFIGTIIIKQAMTEKLGTTPFELIDGQQRLTTISLLLRALHDSTDEASFKIWIKNLLIFTDSYGKPHMRIQHSKVDREYFGQIMLSEDDNSTLAVTDNRVVQAYKYFRDKIRKDIAAEDIRTVVTILLNHLPVIHMALNREDDVQQIFDTINSLGVKLTTGELLKNHLFSSPEMENKYEQYWESVFEADEDAIDFWNQDKTSGRVIRTTIELFLYSYLIIKQESMIKIESLFKQYKSYLKGKTPAELDAFAKELNEYAQLYATLPDGKNLVDISFTEHEKRFFHIMNEMDINTVFPLVLFIYKNVPDEVERLKILGYLESYLVRRNICRLTTKNYNNLFIAILVELKKQKTFTAEDFKNKLLSFTEDTNKFPADEEFKTGFFGSHLINKYAREVLYNIALYQMNNDYQDNKKLSLEGFSLEHVMPKKWRNNWTLPEGMDAKERDHKLLTLGNLTLVMGKLNSSMRDANWPKKKTALTKYSTLRLTTDYLGKEDWQEEVIDQRGTDLFNAAMQIWKR